MKLSWKQYERWIRYGAVGIIAGLCLWNANSLVTGRIETMFTPREIHDEYYRYREFINAQDEYFRVLSIPVPSKWMVYTNTHPKVSMVDLVRGDWKEFSLPAIGGHPERNERKWLSPLERDFSNQLLDRSAIRYVVVPRDDPENADDFFGAYGKRDIFLAHLDGLEYLQKIDVGTGDVVVYKNEGARPHIYTTKEIKSLEEDELITEVSFLSISPSEYRISLPIMDEENREGLYVNFSEKYHPDWRVRIGEFHWWDVFQEENYFLSSEYHYKNEAGLNTFFIPKEEVEKDTTITLFFRPQAYLYGGLIISGGVFALCFVFVVYAFVKSVRRRRKNHRSE